TLNETATFKDIKAKSLAGEEDLDVDDVEFSSGDSDVAEISSDGKITPISTGIIYFTLKKDNAEEEHRIKFFEEDRKIKFLYTSLDNEEGIKAVTGSETSFTM